MNCIYVSPSDSMGEHLQEERSSKIHQNFIASSDEFGFVYELHWIQFTKKCTEHDRNILHTKSLEFDWCSARIH